MAENKQYYIGIDVGGTSVKLGLFDEGGRPARQDERPHALVGMR